MRVNSSTRHCLFRGECQSSVVPSSLRHRCLLIMKVAVSESELFKLPNGLTYPENNSHQAQKCSVTKRLEALLATVHSGVQTTLTAAGNNTGTPPPLPRQTSLSSF